ncbi:MAG: hypothetical protein ACYDBY_01590 [Thermoanaerobaculia bacterium]
MAQGTLSAAVLRGALRGCESDEFPAVCRTALKRVLEAALNEGGEDIRSKTLDALTTIAAQDAGEPMEMATDLLTPNTSRSARMPQARTREQKWYLSGEQPNERVTKEDLRNRATLLAKLFRLLDHHLPESGSERVAEALEAARAGSCEAFLAGRLIEECRAVGLGELKLKVLQLALQPLSQSEGDLEVVNWYLSLSDDALVALEAVAAAAPETNAGAYVRLIASWRRKAPQNRWQAWSDLETLR